MLIRIVRAEDLIDVCRIENLCFPDPYPAMLFNYWYEFNRNGFFVAEEFGKIVGYALNDVSRKEMLSIAVHLEHRGKSIGSQLLKSSLEYFKENNVKKVRIHVRVSNKNAQAFYLSHGFKQKKIVKAYYSNEDGWLMEKSLTE